MHTGLPVIFHRECSTRIHYDIREGCYRDNNIIRCYCQTDWCNDQLKVLDDIYDVGPGFRTETLPVYQISTTEKSKKNE